MLLTLRQRWCISRTGNKRRRRARPFSPYGRFRTDRIAVLYSLRAGALFLIKLSVCSLIRYRSDCKMRVAVVGRSVYYLCGSSYKQARDAAAERTPADGQARKTRASFTPLNNSSLGARRTYAGRYSIYARTEPACSQDANAREIIPR